MMAIKTQPPLKREIKRFQPTLYIAREVRRMEVDGGYASAILAPKGEEGPVGGHLEVMATRVIRPEGFRFNVRGGPRTPILHNTITSRHKARIFRALMTSLSSRLQRLRVSPAR